MSICRVCNRPLKTPSSLKLGVGRTCAKRVNSVLTGQMNQEAIKPKFYDGTNDTILRAEAILRKQNQEQRDKQRAERKTITKATQTPAPQYEHSAELQQALKEAEQAIRFNEAETMYVFGKDGNIRWKKRGGKRSVHIVGTDMSYLPNSVLTHNHPSDDSFSDADVNLMIKEQIFEIRAVGRENEYSIRLKDDIREGCKFSWERQGLADKVQAEFDVVYAEVTTERANKVRSGEILRSELDTGTIHETWERVNRRMGNIFIYERKTTPVIYDQDRMEKLLKKDKKLKMDYDNYKMDFPNEPHENLLKELFNRQVVRSGKTEMKYQEIS